MKQKQLDFEFHDYKTEPPSKSWLNKCCEKAGWETLLNKRSTTWRSLSTVEQSAIANEAAAIDTMIKHNSIIKRPLIAFKGEIVVGFDEAAYSKIFLDR